jgi:hypothetical protein
LANEWTDGLVGFLLKSGDEIGNVKIAAAAGREHVLQRLPEGVRTGAIE